MQDNGVRTVATVGGDVRIDRLGPTLMHEHVFVLTPDVQGGWPGFMGWDEEREIERARAKLAGIKRGGIDTIVDLTAPGVGRNVRLIAAAAEGTGLQVVVCTGFYTVDGLPLPWRFNPRADELMVELFVRDIEEGIEGTDIKAGVLKCATDVEGVTPGVERVLRAVARAHLETGVPISTHTHAGTRRGLDQQRIFREEGVDLGAVVIGHSNETTDLGYLEEVMDAGSLIGFDRCGCHLTTPLDDQLDTAAELCRRGYAERIVVSHDKPCFIDWLTEEEEQALLPDHHYGYVQGEFFPGLRERGVSEAQIERLIEGNPRDFFAYRAKKSVVA
jgi:phosphotriesterase-related protein